MPISGKLLAGVAARPATRIVKANPNWKKPPGLILGDQDEVDEVNDIAKLGGEAFRQGGHLGDNPFKPLRQPNFHNAWATGFKAAQKLQQIETPTPAIQSS